PVRTAQEGRSPDQDGDGTVHDALRAARTPHVLERGHGLTSARPGKGGTEAGEAAAPPYPPPGGREGGGPVPGPVASPPAPSGVRRGSPQPVRDAGAAPCGPGTRRADALVVRRRPVPPRAARAVAGGVDGAEGRLGRPARPGPVGAGPGDDGGRDRRRRGGRRRRSGRGPPPSAPGDRRGPLKRRGEPWEQCRGPGEGPRGSAPPRGSRPGWAGGAQRCAARPGGLGAPAPDGRASTSTFRPRPRRTPRSRVFAAQMRGDT